MTKNIVNDELNLLAECVIFARKWLCWRKWLRVNGILEWSLNGLQVSTDEGNVEPIYRYEASRKKYFTALVSQRKTAFVHFPIGHRKKNLTGEELAELMVREQRMRAIEREWCRINGEAIFRNRLFNMVLDKPVKGAAVSVEQGASSADRYRDYCVDSVSMVDFYRRLCDRLVQIIGLRDDRHINPPPRFHETTIPGDSMINPTWRIDNTLRTFDDDMIFLIIEMMAFCTIENTLNDSDIPTTKEKLWFSVPMKRIDGLYQEHVSVTINLNDRKDTTRQDPFSSPQNAVTLAGFSVKSQADERDGNHRPSQIFATPVSLKWSSIRSMLNQNLMPKNILYFQPEIKVEKNITYGKIIMNLIDNHSLNGNNNNPYQHDSAMLTCQTELDEWVKIVQLKNIARFLIGYSTWHELNGVTAKNNDENDRFFFFPDNGIEWYSPITEALLLLFNNKKEDGMTTTINMNHYEMHDRVMIPDDIDMNDAIAAYRQQKQPRIADTRKRTRLFSLRVTSLLFNRDSIKIAAKRLDKNSTSGCLNTQKGFYLRHEKYRNIIMVFLPSNAVPQYDRQLQFADNFTVFLGTCDDDQHAYQQRSQFLRLILVRAEEADNEQSPESLSQRVNLDDPLILCAFLKEITDYFDPRRQHIDRLFRVDPFLSKYVDIMNKSDYQLNTMDIDRKSGKQGQSTRKIHLNVKLWKILRDKPPPKSLLVRSSPVCYGPELYWYGITQCNRGIVPFEINTNEDTWKLYAYDDPVTNELLDNKKLIHKTEHAATRDKADNSWMIAKDQRIVSQAIIRQPVIVRLINWYDEHYPQGKPTIKKMISKRIYLINNIITFCEDPTKLVCGEKYKIAKVQKIHDWNFAHCMISKKYNSTKNNMGHSNHTINPLQTLTNDVYCHGSTSHVCNTDKDRAISSTHFSNVVYKPMRDNNINYQTKKKPVRLRFYETPFFFVMFFQCTHFWFPKWQCNRDICYDGVPKHLVPLIQWSLDNAIITP